MSKAKKTAMIIVSVISVCLCVFCCVYIYQFFRGTKINTQVAQLAVSAAPAPEAPAPEAPAPAETPEEAPQVQEPAVPTIESSIDFDALAEVNEEIYAWIEIPGTGISQPVLQSQSDDLFYNNHNVDKSFFTGGAVYSQRYNTQTFDDPMTLIYGHNFHDQSIFAPLLNFIDVHFFTENRYIYLYTPEQVYEYEIFAAYPHTSEHLLLCYDFSKEEEFDEFFGALSDGRINANFDREAFPEFGEKIVTLSTCYRLSRGQRYLVQGVLSEVYQVVEEAS